MMGERTVPQEALFYSFNLERHVPAHHLLRSIDRFVDLSDVREQLRPFYSETGRPSIDPELMLRMLIIGYERPRTTRPSRGNARCHHRCSSKGFGIVRRMRTIRSTSSRSRALVCM